MHQAKHFVPSVPAAAPRPTFTLTEAAVFLASLPAGDSVDPSEFIGRLARTMTARLNAEGRAHTSAEAPG
jgi:hypothetical protein